jgi:hypothetical protein
VIVAAQPRIDEVDIWPENWPVFRLFCGLQTQWRPGMAGAVGLVYEAVYPLLDRLAPRQSDEWAELLDDIRAMELEAMSVMREE